MTHVQHTPGPWTISGPSQRQSDQMWYATIEDAEGIEVCRVEHVWRQGVIERAALLIAAAPDMLAALERARDTYKYAIAHLVNPRQIISWRQELALLDAAIAKAAAQGKDE